MRRLLLVPAIAALALWLAPAPARAAAPRDQGWWTTTSPLPAPDVPARGLLIQGGGGGAPTAYAAVLYELDPGTTAGTLTFTIAANSATTPSATLQVCGLLQPIVHPDQGGPLSNAPPYDCSRKATAAPQGTSYKFDGSGLAADRIVAVAILPNGPLDRVVLNAPDDNSLATQAGVSDSAPAASPAVPDTAPTDTATAPSGDLSSSSAPVGNEPIASVSLPGVATNGPSSVAPAPAAAPTRQSSAGVFLPAVSTGSEKATPILVILLVIGCLGAAGLWLYAGRQEHVAPI